MRIFGSWSELLSLIFRKDGQVITTRPNQSVTYTASRDVQLPPQDANSILVSETATQTLINKTLSGASNTITNVSLTTGVTGTLPIGNGGTGQTTANPAFNALAPTTTKGDLIAFSTVNARLPVGTNGHVLTADSAETMGIKWAPSSGASLASADGTTAGSVKTYIPEIKLTINSLTNAGYTVLDNDGYNTIAVSAGASDRTVTLPTLADNLGRVIEIVKTDSGAGYVYLDAEGSETINGSSSAVAYGCYGIHNSLTVKAYSDGWRIVCSDISGTYIPTASSVLNTGTITFYNISYVRVGRLVTVAGKWSSSSGFDETSAFTMSLPIPAVGTLNGDDLSGFCEGAENASTANYNASIGGNGGNAARVDGHGASSAAGTRYNFRLSYNVL